ncbi:MAG: hypothetical protein IPK68_20695 [Bdellovibrionales bacterium]|nr:hypothetical protein [Bdellovibrionales bacterium]
MSDSTTRILVITRSGFGSSVRYIKKSGIPYFAWVYPNTIDTEIAEILAESGCDSVEMEFSQVQEHLRVDIMHRKTSDAQIMRKQWKPCGMQNSCHPLILSFGLPSETKNDLDLTVDLVRYGSPLARLCLLASLLSFN